MLDNFLNNLQKKSFKTRKKIMRYGVIFCAFFIFMGWLFLTPHSSSQQGKNKEGILKIFRKEITEKAKEINFNQMSADIEEVSKNIVNNQENQKNQEIKANEIPRLPIE